MGRWAIEHRAEIREVEHSVKYLDRWVEMGHIKAQLKGLVNDVDHLLESPTTRFLDKSPNEHAVQPRVFLL